MRLDDTAALRRVILRIMLGALSASAPRGAPPAITHFSC
jgi:hypothetical protein